MESDWMADVNDDNGSTFFKKKCTLKEEKL